MIKPALIENMYKRKWGGYTLRFWWQEPTLSDLLLLDDMLAVRFDLPVREIALRLLSLRGMNSVEWVDAEGNGEVLYKEWP